MKKEESLSQQPAMDKAKSQRFVVMTGATGGRGPLLLSKGGGLL
jgi:hypothetical protein